MSLDPRDFARLLDMARQGDGASRDRLFHLVYDELRGIARNRLRNGAHSIQATELVNDAYVRLVHKDQLTWENRNHFFSVVARAMQDILVERARRRGAQKRGGGAAFEALHSGIAAVEANPASFLELNSAIERLGEEDPRCHEVVVLKFFVGLGGDEIAKVMGTSPSTIDRLWKYAKAWLHRSLADDN